MRKEVFQMDEKKEKKSMKNNLEYSCQSPGMGFDGKAESGTCISRIGPAVSCCRIKTLIRANAGNCLKP